MNYQINVEKREISKKKSVNKNMRKQGFIPAVLYSSGKKGLTLKLKDSEFFKVYKKSIGEVAFFDFELSGKKYSTIIKDRQIHPTKRNIIHLDFLAIEQDKPISIKVPLNITGESAGVKKGGILDVLLRELEVTCLPKDMPEDFKVDVTSLDIGDSLTIADIDTKGLDVTLDDDVTIVHVIHPKMEVEEVEQEEKLEEEETEKEESETEEK